MPATFTAIPNVAKQRHEVVAVRAVRSTIAAVLAYLVALRVLDYQSPLLAPLTALLVVEVTLYSTLTRGLRRIGAVLVGVFIAIGFAEFIGLTWWSLGILILVCLAAGQLLHVEPFVEEVAISGMLVLGVGNLQVAHVTADQRVAETMVGVTVGMLFNLVFAPRPRVQRAGEAVNDVSRRLGDLLDRIAGDLSDGASRRQAYTWFQEARAIDGDITQVDGALSEAEESMRLNPRATRNAVSTSQALRSGLDSLEHCAVTMRSVCRGLVDLSDESGRYSTVYPREVAAALRTLMHDMAESVSRFGEMLTVESTAGAENAESALDSSLAKGRADRDRIAALLRTEADFEPDTWELHGSLLASVDQILAELDVGRRAQLYVDSCAPPRARHTHRRRQAVRRRRSHAHHGPHGGTP